MFIFTHKQNKSSSFFNIGLSTKLQHSSLKEWDIGINCASNKRSIQIGGLPLELINSSHLGEQGKHIAVGARPVHLVSILGTI